MKRTNTITCLEFLYVLCTVKELPYKYGYAVQKAIKAADQNRKLKKQLIEEKKYKWHDLRRRKADLPKEPGWYMVMNADQDVDVRYFCVGYDWADKYIAWAQIRALDNKREET